PILDNFDLAEKNIEKELKSNKTIDGFLRIKKQLLEFLRNEGVEEIKSLGEIFDPFVHEAVEELERDNKRPGTILEEVQKGYKINGRLLRPAKVKIAKKVDKNS
ncbi:MAG TPA: nucleotide exchange factor GrpE, partial [Candidatus Parcubacteria bacterium]|nr:nucleotide exchange factor GrpE [Candidatus Parcubacteria bacterium]